MRKKASKARPRQPLKSRFEIRQQEKIVLPDNLPDETLLTQEEAAAYCQCSVRTIIRWIKERGLCQVRQGNVSRIRKGELDRFLKGQGENPVVISTDLPDFFTEGHITDDPEFRERWKKMWRIGEYNTHFFGRDLESDMEYLKKLDERDEKSF